MLRGDGHLVSCFFLLSAFSGRFSEPDRRLLKLVKTVRRLNSLLNSMANTAHSRVKGEQSYWSSHV